jgi:hypothetical protein
VATDWVAKVNETAQEQVPEPVVASGILQPAGTWGSFGLDQVSGVAAMFKRRKVNKDAGGLARTSWKGTKTVLLAVTGEKLYAFAVKQKGRNWKVEGQLGVWNRSDLDVETTPASWPRRSSSTSSPPASTTSSRRRPSAAPGSTTRSSPRSRPEAQNFPVRPKR